ncbi:MAG: hypothetical protein HXS48_06100 [Theionarchaea archaeon]|nr:hypothetical protein [Theionarchaea archaeon]
MALCIIIVWSFIFHAFAFDNVSTLPVSVSLAGGCDVPMFGPFSGSLSHKKDDIEEYHASMKVEDFIAEATFKNPYSTTKGKWDYGFLFRYSKGTFHAIRVTSDGKWTHDVVFHGEWDYLKGGNVSGLQTGADQKNHLRIIVIGDNGWFYVNGLFVASLDTSGLTRKGDIAAATGMYTNYGIEGKTTDFEDFTIWSLDVPTSGPSSRRLKSKGLDYLFHIKGYQAKVDVKDFIAEATFKNPDPSTEGRWDYGFLFRYFEGTFHAIRVTSDGKWTHDVVTDGEWDYFKGGSVSGLQTGANQKNHLRIIVIGDNGSFYVNGQLVTELDTSGLTQKGDIAAATGIYSFYSIGDFDFEDFTIWSLDGCPELPRLGDIDNDGTIDDRDNCYNPDCNIVNSRGCPKDSDGDGVNDCDDECPSRCTKVDSNGCPLDSDGDGVNDCDDKCPSECTKVDSNGCPLDSDGDGVNDCDDECPHKVGPPDKDGCPGICLGTGVLVVLVIIGGAFVGMRRTGSKRGRDI